jgi:DNA repair protein RadC
MENSLILTEEKVSEISVSYSSFIPFEKRLLVNSSQISEKAFRKIWKQEEMELRESFKMMILNKQKHLLGIITLFEGGTDNVSVDIRLLLAIALKSNASTIILAHNHPSGLIKPSYQDRTLTERIVQAASIFDIEVCDHLILTAENYFSFSDNGIIDEFNTSLQDYFDNNKRRKL